MFGDVLPDPAVPSAARVSGSAAAKHRAHALRSFAWRAMRIPSAALVAGRTLSSLSHGSLSPGRVAALRKHRYRPVAPPVAPGHYAGDHPDRAAPPLESKSDPTHHTCPPDDPRRALAHPRAPTSHGKRRVGELDLLRVEAAGHWTDDLRLAEQSSPAHGLDAYQRRAVGGCGVGAAFASIHRGVGNDSAEVCCRA